MCEKEIPTYKKVVFGEEREYIKRGKIKHFYGEGTEVDLNNHLGIDLCEVCAAKLTLNLLEIKTNILLGKCV